MERVRSMLVALGLLVLLAPVVTAGDDPNADCQAACKERVLAEVEACIARGGDEEACRENFERRVDACVLTNCQGEPPPPVDPPPSPCEECFLLREAMVQECVDASGQLDPECVARWRLEIDACLARCQGEPPPPVDPPPPPSPCEECFLLREAMVQECADANGQLDPECVAMWRLKIDACLAECQGEPPPPVDPPPVSCEERCAQLRERLIQRCTSADGQIDPGCREMIVREIEACMAGCKGEPPPPPPEPVACEDRCKRYGEELEARCLREDGTIDATCLAEVATRVRACMAGCSELPPPPTDTCASRCEERARAAMAACMEEEGADPAACKSRFERSFQACLATCGGGEEEPPPPCDEECVAKARGLFQACVEAGGDAQECRDRADGVLGLCVERCAGREPCESRCALAAQVVLTGCSLGGLPAQECRRLANMVLERCVAGCLPAPTCEDRCAELARSAVRECVARGGEDAECRAKAADVMARCAANCEGEPVPPCDIQCEEKADAIAAECAERGNPETDCAAVRRRFLADCLAHHETDCAQELRAELTLFRPFIRGDSNRDGVVNVTDPVSLLEWLFRSGEEPACKDAADANDDGKVDVSDAVAMLSYLFLGGALPEPAGAEGQDPTSDALLCEG